jgi:hypothetical protein
VNEFEGALRMYLPDYVTIEEVQRVCRDLGFRDWTQLLDTAVLPEEAEVLQQESVSPGNDSRQ